MSALLTSITLGSAEYAQSVTSVGREAVHFIRVILGTMQLYWEWRRVMRARQVSAVAFLLSLPLASLLLYNKLTQNVEITFKCAKNWISHSPPTFKFPAHSHFGCHDVYWLQLLS